MCELIAGANCQAILLEPMSTDNRHSATTAIKVLFPHPLHAMNEQTVLIYLK